MELRLALSQLPFLRRQCPVLAFTREPSRPKCGGAVPGGCHPSPSTRRLAPAQLLASGADAPRDAGGTRGSSAEGTRCHPADHRPCNAAPDEDAVTAGQSWMEVAQLRQGCTTGRGSAVPSTPALRRAPSRQPPPRAELCGPPWAAHASSVLQPPFLKH